MVKVIALYVLIIFVVSGFLAYKSYRRIKKKELSNTLDNLLKISCNFPFLEDVQFIDEWNKHKETSKSMIDIRHVQYEEYCVMLFCFIETTYNFFKSEKKMLKYYDFKNWAINHRIWWENYSDRYDYGKKIKKIINDWLLAE